MAPFSILCMLGPCEQRAPFCRQKTFTPAKGHQVSPAPAQHHCTPPVLCPWRGGHGSSPWELQAACSATAPPPPSNPPREGTSMTWGVFSLISHFSGAWRTPLQAKLKSHLRVQRRPGLGPCRRGVLPDSAHQLTSAPSWDCSQQLLCLVRISGLRLPQAGTVHPTGLQGHRAGQSPRKRDPCAGQVQRRNKAHPHPHRMSVSAANRGQGPIHRHGPSLGRDPGLARTGGWATANPPDKFRDVSARDSPQTPPRNRRTPVACAGGSSALGAPRLAPRSPFPPSCESRACAGHVARRPQPRR